MTWKRRQERRVQEERGETESELGTADLRDKKENNMRAAVLIQEKPDDSEREIWDQSRKRSETD